MGLAVLQQNKQRNTYAAAVTDLVSVASATDIFTIYGSASKTIVVTQVEVTGTSASKTIVDVLLIKRSTANTGGTSSAPTVVPLDSTNPAGTGTVLAYTANPTLGTAVGTVHSNKLPLSVGATDSPQSVLLLFDGNSITQGVYLRGTGEGLCVNLNGASLSSPLLNIDVIWYEI